MKNSILLFFISLLVGYVKAQVSIAPTAVFANSNGIGVLYVSNSSDIAQEVSISFLFGYPGNDDEGNLVMIYNDTIQAKKYGLEDRIRIFPKAFILGPGEQQTVRFQVRPDQSKPQGTYFTRIKVLSGEQTVAVEETTSQNINAQVNFKLEQVIPAFYKQGKTSTGLEFTKLDISKTENIFYLNSEFIVLGNSPYLGSLNVIVRSSDGNVIGQHEQTLALYFSGKRTFGVPIPEDLGSGVYEVEVKFDTNRSDIATSNLIFAEPIVKKFYVQL